MTSEGFPAKFEVFEIASQSRKRFFERQLEAQEKRNEILEKSFCIFYKQY
jgi:hypothetical protein